MLLAIVIDFSLPVDWIFGNLFYERLIYCLDTFSRLGAPSQKLTMNSVFALRMMSGAAGSRLLVDGHH